MWLQHLLQVPFLEVGGGSARGGPRTSIDSGILPRILRTAAMWLDLDARHRAAILAKVGLRPDRHFLPSTYSTTH